MMDMDLQSPRVASTMSSTSTPESTTIESLYVIYDADGTRTGELLYITKKLLGLAHCAACDITHGPRREKPEFTLLKGNGWSVPLHNIHRDEMDKQMTNAVDGIFPCVVARTHYYGDMVIMKPYQLEQCSGDVIVFQKSVNESIREMGLTVPEPAMSKNFCQLSSYNIQSVEENDDAVVPSC